MNPPGINLRYKKLLINTIMPNKQNMIPNPNFSLFINIDYINPIGECFFESGLTIFDHIFFDSQYHL